MCVRTFHGLNGDVLSESAASTLKFCIQDASELACNVSQMMIGITQRLIAQTESAVLKLAINCLSPARL